MKLLRNQSDTSVILQVFIQDSSKTTGVGLTGLVYNTTSLTGYYHKDTDTTATSISLVTMTVGTYTSGGFKEIDATNMPGWYQFCPPNAALNSTGKSVAFMLKGATNMAPCVCELQMPDTVSVGGVAGNVTGAVGSVTGNVGGSVGSVTGAVGSVTGAVGSVTGAVGSVTGAVGSVTGSVGSVAAAITLPTDFTATMKTSITTAATAATPTAAAVTGAVGSVTGAVGSVTAAIVLPSDFTTTMKASITTAATAATPTVHLTYTQAIKKNTALTTFMFAMFDPTGTPKTGLGAGITATRSLDGASFAACTSAPSEIANGWYLISLSAADLNANVVALHFTATGAVATDVSIVTAQA
jgi:hypothetical protein